MPDKKLSELTALTTTPANSDEFYIRDVSETASGKSKQITFATLKTAVGASAINAPVQAMTGSEDMSNSPSIDTPTKAWS